jgi:hypothetical protein
MSKSKEPKPVSKSTKGQKEYSHILKEYAGKFQQWLDTKPGRSALTDELIKRSEQGEVNGIELAKHIDDDNLKIADSLLDILSEDKFIGMLGWLERNRPLMFEQLKRFCAWLKNDTEQLYAPSAMWQVSSQGQDLMIDTLIKHVSLFVNMLEDTADELQETEQPTEREPTENNGGKTVEIDLQPFSKTRSKQLLEDLITYPKGVKYDESRHGKDQPKALQRMLQRKKRYPQIAADITLKKGIIFLKTFTLKKKG